MKSGTAKHLIVISVDALNGLDQELIRTLPNFKSFYEEGSYAKEVVGIYPSLTYPSHTSILTGCYPEKHGIICNTIAKAEDAPLDWFWHYNHIQCETLIDVVNDANLKTGSILWPVMAKAPIKWNCPEIWSNSPKANQTITSLRNGTKSFLITLSMKYGHLLNGHDQPNLDEFTTAGAEYLIRKHKPHLALIHILELDHNRHYYGTHSPEAKQALINIDKKIGQIIQATKDAGIFEDTAFVVLGDHGFADFTKLIHLNVKFVENGLISIENNQIVSAKAFANTCDGSVQIHVEKPEDEDEVFSILESLKNDPANGIDTIYTKEMLKDKYHIEGDFSFMLEAKDGFAFGQSFKVDFIEDLTEQRASIKGKNDHIYFAFHGFDPFKDDYRTLFMAKGKGINKGVAIDTMNLVDEGPTLAAMLGLKFKNSTDGKVLNDILQK